MRLDRPSSGSDKPSEGNHPPPPVPPPDSSYWSYGRRPPDSSQMRDSAPDRTRETAGEFGEGTGWPKDKKPEVPKTPEERVKELESELGKTKRELYEARGELARTGRELRRTSEELKAERASREKLTETNARLTDTNAALVRDNRELREKTGHSSALDRKETRNADAQAKTAHKPPRHRNWFPTDKVGAFGGAVAGAAGSYAVMVGSAGSKEEAFAVACTGAGVAGLALGREITTKVHDWRDRRAAKNADRQQGQ